MIKLRDAKLTDAIPAALAAQPWAQALAYAEWKMRCLMLDYAQEGQIYTALDTCPEYVLDALAVSWKVDWYDTDYPEDIKRNVIKNSMLVHRYMGTAWSVKKALSDIWPDSDLEEWFEYGGQPGNFRVACNVTNQTIAADANAVESSVMLYKRASAHLEGVSFMVRRGVQIGVTYETYQYSVPRCGTMRCGTWRRRATLGMSRSDGTALAADVGTYTATPARSGKRRCGAGVKR